MPRVFGRKVQGDSASRPIEPSAAAGEFRLGAWPEQLHAELDEFLHYWLAKHSGDGRLPSRSDINPAEIPHLLTGIALIDVERRTGTPRYRFRLLGTRHSQVNGRDLAGRYIDEAIPAEALPEIVDAFGQVVEKHLPHYARADQSPFATKPVATERVVVPLAADGYNVNMLFSHWIFHMPGEANWHWWREHKAPDAA